MISCYKKAYLTNLKNNMFRLSICHNIFFFKLKFRKINFITQKEKNI